MIAFGTGWSSQGLRSQVAQELAVVDDLLAKGTKLAAVHALRAQTLAKDAAAFAAYKAGVIDPVARAGRTSARH